MSIEVQKVVFVNRLPLRKASLLPVTVKTKNYLQALLWLVLLL